MTLNQLKNILKEWFGTHRMVITVLYEDDFDRNGEATILYPLVEIEFINSSTEDKVINYTFKISIESTTQPDNNEHEDNIHSDALQIAEDFITYLRNVEGFWYNRSTSYNKFTDDGPDRTSGIVFTVTLSSIMALNRYNIPT